MSPGRRDDLLSAAILTAAILAAYANATQAGFQFDDWNVIVHDPRVQDPASWWASMPGIRPLLKLTYALNHASGLGAAGFHAVNVAIHAAAALMVLALLRALARRGGVEPGAARPSALVGALLFALHPVQTEAVTYASGRSTSLCAALALGSVVAWIHGSQTGKRWVVHGLSPVLFAAALGVKEMAVAVPFALLLLEATDRRRRFHLARTSRALAGHGAILIAAGVAFLASPTYRALMETSLHARPAGANLRTQAEAVVYLAGQLVRPDRLNADPMLEVSTAWTAGAVLSVLVVLTALAAGFAGLRKHPEAAFGVLWFFLWLAPTHSLLPRLDVANDRQLYAAMIGPVWLVVWGLHHTLTRRRAVAVAAAACLVLGVLTFHRNGVYADEVSFWTDVARKSPRNARAWNNLGYAYAMACDRDRAEESLRRALGIDPQDVRAAVNLRLLLEGGLAGAERCEDGAFRPASPR